MSGLGYACAVVLAAVFVRAGVAKGLRPRETAASFAALGVPEPGATARVVPLSELLLAVLVLAVPRAGGIAALVLLAAFSVILGQGVRRGVSAGCNCFGAARVDPVSGADLVRNGLLALLAVAALLAPGPTTPGAPALVAVAALVVAGTLLLRAGRIRRRP